MIYALLLLLLALATGPRPAAAQAAPDTGATPGAAAPAAVDTPAAGAVRKLRADLERIIERPGWRDDRWSVLVTSLDRGDTLFAHHADRPLAPASNMKLFTTAAALYYLGPDYRYTTYLMTDGVVRDGVLHGDLIVYGTGDPTLSGRFHDGKLAVWEEFADALAGLGIREIRGNVVGDASYFDGLATGVGWAERYMNAWYAAPACALSFNDNVVTLHATPADAPGWRPEIQFIPGGEGIAIVNQAITSAGGRSRIRVDRAAYDGPIVIRGQIRQGHAGIWRAVPVADPARYAATVFREVLEDRGLRVTGEVRSVHDEAASRVTGRQAFAPAFDDGGVPVQVLAVHRSPPLLEILSVINQESHNFYAEQVLRTVGRAVFGEGSVAAGARATRALLEREAGVAAPVLRMLDGSGLSVLNRVDARTVVALLSYMADSPLWEAYWATLPEAGNAQGLRRMYRTAAARNLRAKTGTIDGVSALSGYVRAADGERLAFSIISNDVPSTWRAKRIEDAIGARLAAFSRPGSGAPAASGPTGPAGTSPAVPARPVGAAPDSTAASAPSRGRYHVIRRGDTLEGIARQYGTSVRALRRANPRIEPRRLIPGERLRLP